MIYVHKDSTESFLFSHICKSGIHHRIIESDDEPEDNKKNIILKPKKDTYCHPCPATKVYNCCNYYTADVMEGCPFDCSYCILQAYLPHRSIHASSDTDTIINSIKETAVKGIKRRMGTGELSDSLALDNIFPYTKLISPVINDQNTVQFEYKTKSVNIRNLLNLNPKNIVASWSINPQEVIDIHEKGAANAADRIKAAAECADAGYRIGFHFDPVIHFEGYEKAYESVINEILAHVPENAVEYISVSTFRGPSLLIDAMRERPVPTPLIQGDMIQALDGKYRYFKPLRIEMMKNIVSFFRSEWKRTFIYLCMESKDVWEEVLNITPGSREGTEALFPWYRDCR